ncbi:helix-turn-helix domain-containing protein [Nonomuraea sp. NPDC003201]
MSAGTGDDADIRAGEECRSLGTLLRAWRNRALLSQDELADRAGVNVRTIRRLEGDAVERPRSASLRALAEALGLDPREQEALAAAARAEPGSPTEVSGFTGREPEMTASPLPPRQLPVGVSGFAGRAGSLAELDRQLDAGAGGTRICIVSGTAGVGKTSLALHWAHRARGRFEDGELYANLQGFGPAHDAADPQDALTAFLEAMGVPPQRIPEDPPARAALYRTTLADKRVLVVLDNARDVEQVRWLLPGGPHCSVIVTSRRQLSGLIAEEGAGLITLDVLPQAESRELLTHRLGRRRVETDPDATDEIIAACARLPLALAIAAGRAVTSPAMPLSALAADLRRAGGDLGGLATADSATSLRVVLARSYDVLPADVARLFRLLAVHPGPDLTATAAASLAGVDPARIRRLLDALLDAHLVTEVTHGRYACHDLLRAFARELAGETEQPAQRRAAACRVVEHYLHTAHEAAVRLYVPAEWLEAPEPGFLRRASRAPGRAPAGAGVVPGRARGPDGGPPPGHGRRPVRPGRPVGVGLPILAAPARSPAGTPRLPARRAGSGRPHG